MENSATLRPARPSRLRWLEPPPPLREKSGEIRRRLEAIATSGATTQVYAAHRRRVHRAEDSELGSIAIKELRNPSLPRQLWFGCFAEHPGLREYRIGNAFAARGGRTLTNLGAALERNAFGLARVLIFTSWLHGSVTLTQWLGKRAQPPAPHLLATLALQIAAAARIGLVHNRHSSNNLLVVMEEGEPALYTIDFPHATLGTEFDPVGLAADVARIARWILHEKLWSRATVQDFFEAVAAAVRDVTPPGEDLAARMALELETVIRNPGARRPASA